MRMQPKETENEAENEVKWICGQIFLITQNPSSVSICWWDQQRRDKIDFAQMIRIWISIWH